MSSTYIYNSGDFSDGLNQNQLFQEILDSSITTPLNLIEVQDQTAFITFDAPLSGPEVTTLNGVVAAHVAVQSVSVNETIQTNVAVTTTSTSYVDVFYFSFLTEAYDEITLLSFISYMDGGGTSYDVRLFDQTNSLVMAEENFTNTKIFF